MCIGFNQNEIILYIQFYKDFFFPSPLSASLVNFHLIYYWDMFRFPLLALKYNRAALSKLILSS